MGCFVCQSQRLTMQARPPTAGTLFRSPVHDALLGQAHQQVSVDFSACQRLQVIPTIQGDHRPRGTRRLRLAHRGDLLQGDLGRRLAYRLRRWKQGQTSTVSGHVRHRHQPLIGPGRTTPFCGQPGSGRYSHVRCGLVRAAGRGQFVPSITHNGRPSTTAESTSMVAKSVRNAFTSIDPSASASPVLGQLRPNAVVKLTLTNVLRCGAVNAASTSSNKLSWRRPRSSYSARRKWWSVSAHRFRTPRASDTLLTLTGKT
jgi:hypothetical protein